MKYFITADIHGYHKEFIRALTVAGYDKKNKNHTLIICGDLFDRGEQPVEIFNYLQTIPLDRLILIWGNHEQLLLNLVHSPNGWCDYDVSNGTLKTLWQFVWGQDLLHCPPISNLTFIAAQQKFKELPVYTWLNDKNIWKNYYEWNKYIFVHGFIPYDKNSPDTDFRTVSDKHLWDEATWACPYKEYLFGHFNDEAAKNKTLVCGHWMTRDIRYHLQRLEIEVHLKGENILDNDRAFVSDHLIGLDACTATSQEINILLLTTRYPDIIHVVTC